jgi:hypothetical protein
MNAIINIGFLIIAILSLVVATIIPVSSRIDLEGNYIGIDCDAFTKEPILWTLAFMLIAVVFVINYRSLGFRGILKRPMPMITLAILILSISFKRNEFQKFDAQTNSSLECLN